MLPKHWLREVGRQGVTVNCIAPGFIKTDMTEALDERELRKLIPVNRFGTAEEVAHAAGFFGFSGSQLYHRSSVIH